MSPEEIEFWHWWVAAIVLIVVEIFAPGTVALWMAVSAAAVGLLLLAVPELTWQTQLIVFSVLSVATVIGWRIYQLRYPTVSDQPMLNRRGEQYVGRVFTLDEAIVNGTGKIHVDDTMWKVEGEDLPEGTQVRVTGVEGTVLTVEPA
jgi:membrane protein implicated in regulation of membrane protease activity